MATDLSKQLAEQTFLRTLAEMERDELRQKNDELARLIGAHCADANNFLAMIAGYGELLQGMLKLEGDASIFFDDMLSAVRRVGEMMATHIRLSRRSQLLEQIGDEPVFINASQSVNEPDVEFVAGDRQSSQS